MIMESMSTKTLAATFLLAFSATGAETQLPSLRTEPTGGGSIFYVKNVSATPLTAYLIELVDYPGSSYTLWQDEIGGEPVAPSQEKKIQVQNMTVGAVPDYVKIQAAIYADGSTAGVPDRVQTLIERRRIMLQTIQDLRRRLTISQEARDSKEHVAATLRQATESMVVRSTGKTSLEAMRQTVGKSLFVDTAKDVESHSVAEAAARLAAREKALKESKPAL